MNRRRKWFRKLEQLRRAWKFCVRDPWYWLKCRVWHQYNVIRIKTLSPTWQDRDRVLLHAAFQILTDFVDREHPFDHFDVMRSQNKDDWEEVLGLYAWWTVERPAREDPFAGPTIKFTKAKLKSAGEADDR